MSSCSDSVDGSSTSSHANSYRYRDYQWYFFGGDEGIEKNGSMALEHSGDEHLNRLQVPTKQGEFAIRLHFVLREVEREGKTDIVSWLPHGRAIKVHNKELFEKEILPNWFQQTKVASFYRQLNHYGFKRMGHGRDKNAYYHELFLKGRPDLAQKIVRKKIKGTGPRKPSVPEDEPDLWAMPRMVVMPTLKNTSAVAVATSAATPPSPLVGAAVSLMELQQQRSDTVAEEELPPVIRVQKERSALAVMPGHNNANRANFRTSFPNHPAVVVNGASHESIAIPFGFPPKTPPGAAAACTSMPLISATSDVVVAVRRQPVTVSSLSRPMLPPMGFQENRSSFEFSIFDRPPPPANFAPPNDGRKCKAAAAAGALDGSPSIHVSCTQS